MKQLSQEAIIELEGLIKQSGGTLNPEDVITRAAKKTSTLHSYFEWNDGEAAHQFRLEQARSLIRIWVVMLPEKPQTPMRMMVSLSSDRGEDGYRRLTDVMADAELRAMLLQEAKRDMGYFRRKYSLLSELAAVFEVMDKV